MQRIKDRTGEVLSGRFRLGHEIGSGGMGVVYAGTQEVLGRRVVVKLMRPDATGQETARFEKEAKLASGVPHPHIVSVYDFGSNDDGELYLVMEHLEGITLRQRIAERGPHPWPWVLERMQQIALALQAAHAAGITHRDLKPANVFLVEQGGLRHFVKVLDFGLAKRTKASPDESDLTRSGEFIGTPAYISPEQIDGEEGDARSDLYSLGVMALELLTGINPFRAATVVKTLIRHLEWTPPSARELDGDVPEGLSRIIARLLAKDPALRPTSATELLEALCRVAEEQPAEAALERSSDATQTLSGAKGLLPNRVPPPPAPQSALHRFAPIVTACSLLVFTALAIFAPSSQAELDRTAALAPTVKTLAILPLEKFDLDPALVDAGRALYFDENLSRPRHAEHDGGRVQISCNTCHPVGGSGFGTTSEPLTNLGLFESPYNTPTTFNAATVYRQTWDARVRDLIDIIEVPVMSKRFMDAGSWDQVHARLAPDARYQALFEKAGLKLGADKDRQGRATGREISLALAEYLKFLTPLDSPFDEAFRGDRQLSSEARRGYQRFQELGCIACHQGRGVGGNMVAAFGVMADPYANRGRCETFTAPVARRLPDGSEDHRGTYCRSDAGCEVSPYDAGRCVDQGLTQPTDFGANQALSGTAKPFFKVPSLRNVAMTPPYFHDGSAKTLAEAIRTMGRLQLGTELNEEDVRLIQAFLETLTGKPPETAQ